MQRSRFSLVVGLALGSTLVACSSEPQTPAPDASASSPPAPSASAPAPAPTASASAAAPEASIASVLVAVRPGMDHAGFFDVKALRDKGWFAVLEALPDDVGAPVKKLVTRCGTAPWGAVDQLAWSGSKDEEFVVVAKLAVGPDVAMTCIENLTGRATEVTVGRAKGLKVGPIRVVARGNMLVGGVGKPFDDVLAGVDAGAAPLLGQVTPQKDQALRVAVDGADIPGAPFKDARVVMTSGATRFAFETDVTATSELAAKALELKAKSSLDELAALSKTGPKLPPISLVRTGDVLHVALTQDGDAKQQLAMLGVLSAVATNGMRRYLMSAKTAEAKNTVGAIARATVAYIERETIDARGKMAPHLCPPNAAPVPKEVPKGNKYASAPQDWNATWADLRFAMSDPQYYRYRVDTAPNRKKCTVVAEGDLDGNGKLSKFSLTIELDKNGVPTIAPELAIQNELE